MTLTPPPSSLEAVTAGLACRSCANSAETGLPGFVQDGCIACLAREIASGDAANRRAADQSAALISEMRRAWPDEADYRKGRALVWAWIGKAP